MLIPTQVLRDSRLVSKQKVADTCPEVLDLLRAAVRASGRDVSYKARGDTPVDALIIEVDKGELRGAGGQKTRLANFLNTALLRRGFKTISESLIPKLVKAAGIISAGLLHIKDTPKIGAAYCAKHVQTHRQVQYHLSAYGPRLGLDQMKNLKCNTDVNATTMGGNRTRYQLRDEREKTHSHGAGGDHLCKFGLEAVLLECVREGGVKLPEGFDLSTHIPSYNASQFFREQPALAHMYVHNQGREGESPYRDIADLSEFISRFPHRFMTPELKVMPFFFLERDNAHGVSSIETRFCIVLFAVLHGAYYVCMISQEAGRSRWHRVEGVNGAAIRGLTGGSFDLPMLVPENAPDEVKQKAQDAVRDEIISEFPITYNSGGAEDGFVSAERPRSTALACGFEFRTPELRAFVDAGKKGVNALNALLAHPDSLKPMPSFDNELGYSGVLKLAWQLLHSSGPLACTKSTAHSFEYKYNPANPGCPPPDSANVQAAVILEALCPGDGYLPQPRPAQDRDGVGTAYQYANLDEVLRRGEATAVDEFYPKHIMDAILAADPSLLELFTANDNTLPSPRLKELTDQLLVDEMALYSCLAECVAKNEYKAQYEEMKDRQLADGTFTYVSAIAAGLGCRPLLEKTGLAPPNWPRKEDLTKAIKLLPGKVKIPPGAKRAALIQLLAITWRNLPEQQRPELRRAFITAAHAPAAAPAAAAAAASPPAAAAAAATPPALTPAAAAPAAVPTAAPPLVGLVVDNGGNILPAPPPPPSMQEMRAEIAVIEPELDVTDAAVEEEEVEAEAEVAQVVLEQAAAEALVASMVEMVTKKCGRCYGWFGEEHVQWDNADYFYVCTDTDACHGRRPAKRARRGQSYRGMARGSA